MGLHRFFQGVNDMKPRKGTVAFFSAAVMLILILDGQTALGGAREGVNLCIQTVVPSLFPFFFLSGVFMDAITGVQVSALGYLGKLFSIPKGLEGLLVCGFLGGYPVGARCIGKLHRNSQISKAEAQRLLRYCCNAGPAFMFGMAGGMFPKKWMIWMLWLIHIASAWMVSLMESSSSVGSVRHFSSDSSLESPMGSSVSAILKVCGWVVLFRVLLSFLNRWLIWILPVEVQVIVSGLLDLTNGILDLRHIGDIPLRFVLCSGMLAWGGLCVIMQTRSVLEGLSIFDYIQGKAFQTILSLLLAAGFMYRAWPIFPCLAVAIIALRCIKQKNSSFLPIADV